MRLNITHINKIKKADIILNGLTVIAGNNDSGKSTVGKLLFSVIKSLSNADRLNSQSQDRIMRLNCAALYMYVKHTETESGEKIKGVILPSTAAAFLKEVESFANDKRWVSQLKDKLEKINIVPQALLDNMPEELVRPEEGRYLGCFDDDGTMIGSLLMMDFEMNVRGKMMKMGAPAYVSTNFLHKKEHIARNLLRVQMGVFAQTGTAVGALHPFNPAFYRKMGYGYCTEQVMYSPRPQYIRSYGDKSGLSYAGPEDEEEILEFYRQYARKTHGATIHPFMDKHRIFDEPYVVICRKNGKITGYLTFDLCKWIIIQICIMTWRCVNWSVRIWRP